MVGEKAFKKYIWVVLIVFLGLTGFFGSQIRHVGFDYDFEKFFPINDEETSFFFEHRGKFESDNDFLLIAVERKQGIFDQKFLKEFNDFTLKAGKLEYVTFTTSITTMEEQFVFPGGGSSSKPYVNFDDFDRERDSARIYKNVELINSFIAEDGKSACIFLRHQDFISKKKSDSIINQLEDLQKNYSFEKVRIAGRTIGQKYYIDKMSTEMIMFVGLSAFLIILFLLLAFRSGWGIILPQIVLAVGIVWLVGLMGFFREPINIILTILPSIMFVVSMSDVVHLVSRYLDALRTEDSVFEAIKLSVKEVGVATLLTSITTSVGFFSLYFVQVQPIQVFGVVMGSGVLIAFLLTFMIMPVLFYLFPGPKYVRKKKDDHFWKKHLHNWFTVVINRPKTIFVIGGVVVAVSIIGMMRIETNNYLMDDLRADEPLKVDFDYLDAHYGGVRPFELAVSVVDTSKTVWDKEFLQQVDSVEQYLTDVYGVTIKTSLVSMLKVMNRSSHAGNVDYYELPTSKRKLKSHRRGLRIVGQGEFIKTIVDSTEKTMRISGTLPDYGNVKVTERNVALKKVLREKEKTGLAKYQITGTAHLFDKNISYLSTSLVKGLGISIIIVAFIIGFVYRSISILILSIIPNVLPLLIIAGIMGYIGVELKTSTSIIFTIAFGIAVDDTIHFLGKFKYELMKGKGKLYALKRSYMTTGKAMILTTFILCAGFLLLAFSSFLGTYYMGLLLCITLFAALIADLTLLPALLLVFYRHKKR